MSLFEKIIALENDAANFGFKWENTSQIMAQIHSECDEITAQLQTNDADTIRLQEEIGDLLHAVFSLCVFCKLSPQVTLEKTLTKFERRLDALKQITKAEGLTTLENHSFDELMKYWNNAKKLVNL